MQPSGWRGVLSGFLKYHHRMCEYKLSCLKLLLCYDSEVRPLIWFLSKLLRAHQATNKAISVSNINVTLCLCHCDPHIVLPRHLWYTITGGHNSACGEWEYIIIVLFLECKTDLKDYQISLHSCVWLPNNKFGWVNATSVGKILVRELHFRTVSNFIYSFWRVDVGDLRDILFHMHHF